MNVKMLTAEQVYDCITVASMLVATDANGFSIARVGNTSRDEFLQQFKTLAGRPTEYQGGIPQALTLMNGTLISSATDLAGSGLLKSLEAPFFTDDQRIEVIYLATLSRQPTSGEGPLLRDYVNDRDPDTSIQEPLADILWALVTMCLSFSALGGSVDAARAGHDSFRKVADAKVRCRGGRREPEYVDTRPTHGRRRHTLGTCPLTPMSREPRWVASIEPSPRQRWRIIGSPTPHWRFETNNPNESHSKRPPRRTTPSNGRGRIRKLWRSCWRSQSRLDQKLRGTNTRHTSCRFSRAPISSSWRS